MRYTVGISEMGFGTQSDDVVVTHALGSCIGIALFDPEANVGGILHYMLPQSKIDKEKALIKPLMFGDTGIPEFFKKAYDLGAKKENMRVVMAGGAHVIGEKGKFDIGSRNITIARKLFWKNNVLIDAEHVGGTFPRTLYLEIGSGKAWFTSHGQKIEL
ncbi:MAG: chemotaxis protein CheD [Fibrobacterales bacterium]